MATKKKFRTTVKNFDEASENMQVLDEYLKDLSNTLKEWRKTINKIDLDEVAKAYPAFGPGGLPTPPQWPPD
ncbi:MAG: hypothetical protein ACREON_06235 [Gemmatimonadaceae bacterium]